MEDKKEQLMMSIDLALKTVSMSRQVEGPDDLVVA